MPIYLSNLGNGGLRRFEYLGTLDGLDKSMWCLQRAVQLTTDAHPGKAARISNLALCQRNRFEHLGTLVDLEDSISNLRNAFQRTEDTHPRKPVYLGNIALCELDRYGRLGELADIEDAIRHFTQSVRFNGVNTKWGTLCHSGRQRGRWRCGHGNRLAELP
jgi:hypothetical protein